MFMISVPVVCTPYLVSFPMSAKVSLGLMQLKAAVGWVEYGMFVTGLHGYCMYGQCEHNENRETLSVPPPPKSP